MKDIRFLTCFLMLLGSGAVSTSIVLAETVELVTYYPAPATGSMHVVNLAVGSEYQDETPGDGTALIYDRLGIGTTQPVGPLHVVGFNDRLTSVVLVPGADTAEDPGFPDIRLGIGTANPLAMLDIQHPEDAVYIRLTGLGGADDNFSGLELRSDEIVDRVWQIAHKLRGTGARNDLQITHYDGTGWYPRVTIQPGGRVGIGITSPDVPLQVESDDAWGIRVSNPGINRTVVLGTNDGANAPFLKLSQDLSNAARTWDLAAGTDDQLLIGHPSQPAKLTVRSDGNLGIGSANPGKILELQRTGDAIIRFRDPNRPAGEWFDLGFPAWRTGWFGWARYSGGAPDTAGSFVMDDVGNVGIGFGVVVPQYKLHVNGQISATNFPAPSDLRLKREIVPLTNVLSRLDRLHSVSFRFDPDKAPAGWNLPESRQIGVIAQEVEAVFPELVSSGGDYKSVDYGRLSAVLLEAVKELRAESQSLRKQMEQLRQQMEDLAKR